jgi:hypothetical protein
MSDRILSLVFIAVSAASPAFTQIRCEQRGPDVFIIGNNLTHKADLSKLGTSESKLYFHIEQKSSNRFRVFIWKFIGTLTDVDATHRFTGDSIEFDLVDALGYGVTEEGHQHLSFYGRDKVTTKGREFEITWISGLPRFPRPVRLVPIEAVPQPKG